MSCVERLAVAGLLAFSFGSVASAAEHSHWSYAGKTGPKEWAALAEENQLCAIGQQQSPIALQRNKASHLADREVAIRFGKTAGKLVNNGHTIQMDVGDSAPQVLGFKGVDFKLAQFHFHTPSEHHLDGKSFPMEMHLVSKDASGKIIVVGVLIKTGKENPTLAPLFADLPASEGASRDAEIDLAALMPSSHRALLYAGSLTTPPCSENVNWVVMEQPIQMSRRQIAAFQKLFHDNHRRIQPTNKRKVVEETAG
ncbi:carbonic anhydrase family protein [Variovorax sp. J2P1-59]|uniref:carbonic anhydrase n=1 Tax=Variovorax flavidus TaxID=3053501 RepID=UPI002577284B|nr:carbonic anhydrase family protein [Variovorax sp. J2P1-59]MDM0077363.1 carbonic anhydrase family protein [Variovorax sp. J2P1-59]